MKFCYNIVKDYGIAIILFTLVTKIILLPLSVWVQKNSIKMVEMQPAINRIKAKYFGDPDTAADEQSKLMKEKCTIILHNLLLSQMITLKFVFQKMLLLKCTIL